MNESSAPDSVGGTLEKIWIKRSKEGPMDPVPQAALRANRGLVGSANQGGRRQVTILEVAGETKPCHAMDEVHMGLPAVMRPDWGGGAFAIVLTDGLIRLGDPVLFEPL